MNKTNTPTRLLNHCLSEPVDTADIDTMLARQRVRGFTDAERADAERAIREDNGEDGERWDLCS